MKSEKISFLPKSSPSSPFRCRCSYIISIAFLAVFLFSLIPLQAQRPDSTAQESKITLSNRPFLKAVPVATSLFVAGIWSFQHDHGVRELRMQYLPNFNHPFDDYLQYTPALIAFGLKIGGVEGRSTWQEWATAGAIGGLSLFTMVNGLKYTICKMRPDFSSPNSFPSGHTATAFFAATWLYKEYRETLPPWFMALGYTMATGTAAGRILNNRHWFSDILAGASLGVLSAEIGYLVSDKIFRKPLIDGFIGSPTNDFRETNPSFVGLTMGLPIGTALWHIDSVFDAKIALGHSIKTEGAFFLKKRWGLGVFVSASSGKTVSVSAEKNAFNEDVIPIKIWECGTNFWAVYPLIWNSWLFGNISMGTGRILPSAFSISTENSSAQQLYLSPNVMQSVGLQAGIMIQFNKRWTIRLFGESNYKVMNVPLNSYTANIFSLDQKLRESSVVSWQLGLGIASALF